MLYVSYLINTYFKIVKLVFLEAIFDLSYLDLASRVCFVRGNKVLNIFHVDI